MIQLIFILRLVLILLVCFAPQTMAESRIIRLATTTSTDNSGLLQVLLPPFEKQHGYEVHVIAVGTGKALRMARQGDADVVLVHAPQQEQLFLAEGYGVNRRDVMENDFIIVGPAQDPAQIKQLREVNHAFNAIASKSSTFISRGDRSGTHIKEMAIWDMAGVTPKGDWYRNAGQGMGAVLQMADQLEAYTLTDRATWLAYRQKLALTILNQGDTALLNPYSIIAVNPALNQDVNYMGAMALIGWMTSRQGQTIIDQFRVNGERLFSPTALPRLMKHD